MSVDVNGKSAIDELSGQGIMSRKGHSRTVNGIRYVSESETAKDAGIGQMLLRIRCAPPTPTQPFCRSGNIHLAN